MDWLRYKLFSLRFVLTVSFHTDLLNLKCLGVLAELVSIPNQGSILATLSKRSSCEKKFSFFQPRLASLFTTVTFNFQKMKNIFPIKNTDLQRKTVYIRWYYWIKLYFSQVLHIFLEPSGLIKKADIVGIKNYLPKFLTHFTSVIMFCY